MEVLVISLYMIVLSILGLSGFHRGLLLYLTYWRHKNEAPKPPRQWAELPVVTVQLPMFNEMYVAERLLEGVAGIDYPNERQRGLLDPPRQGRPWHVPPLKGKGNLRYKESSRSDFGSVQGAAFRGEFAGLRAPLPGKRILAVPRRFPDSAGRLAAAGVEFVRSGDRST